MRADKALRANLESAGQGHLADHFETLDERRRGQLVGQIESIDFELLEAMRNGVGLAPPPPRDLAPLQYVALAERGEKTAAARAGRNALRAGQVGFILLAGGQASRLGVEGPKGTVAVGPRTDRSLFRILVEQIVRAGKDHGVTPTLAVTTSTATDAAIKEFFERHDCFGFDRERLRFACQASLPALDKEGRLLLSAKGGIFRNPDGHGGAVAAVADAGILEEWSAGGIETVCTFQVDNPLLKVVDDDFIGRLRTNPWPIATKIVLKTDPHQKVGNVVRANGRPAIVEYSEIGDRAEERDEDGQLTFRLGSIAAHAFDLPFLRDALAEPLPLHRADKEIACLDAEGSLRPVAGVKFERFLFDIFPRADHITVVEIDHHEFSPLKNSLGPHSLTTVQAALEEQYARWYTAAGVFPPDERPLELSPLDAVGPQDLQPEQADT